MRHVRTVVVTAIMLMVGVAVPSVSAQEANLESCSITPSTATIGPGEVAEFTFTFNPPLAQSILISTFDGEPVDEGFSTAPEESPSIASLGYEELVELFSEALERPVTDGVVGFSFNIVVGEGDDERIEALCSYSIVLVASPEPDPETTTTTVPLPEPATPRYTG